MAAGVRLAAAALVAAAAVQCLVPQLLAWHGCREKQGGVVWDGECLQLLAAGLVPR